MMNGREKSDSVVVAVKSTNNGTQVPAEPMEPRTEPKGNPGGQSTRRTQCRESASQAADRIRQFVRREPRERLTALLHHVSVDALRQAFFELKKDAAAGADGMTWRMYDDVGIPVKSITCSGANRSPVPAQTDHPFRRKPITCWSEATREFVMISGRPFRSTVGFAFASSLLSGPVCEHCARDGRESGRR